MPDHANKRILLSVLNWGLGHATRCVPLIDAWLDAGHSVTLASDGNALAYLQQRYPNLPHLELPSLNLRYSKRLPAWWMIFRQSRPFVRHRQSDYQVITKFLADHPHDVLVSDNRYGSWSTSVPSILITHQLQPIAPFALRWTSPIVSGKLRFWFQPFHEIWIPDVEDEAVRISGKLSKPLRGIPPVRFMGPISRLTHSPQPVKQYTVVALLSGPEPQRSLLEEKLKQQLNALAGRSVIIGGKPGGSVSETSSNVEYLPFADDDKLAQLLQSAELVVARSGYSSLMDLIRLQVPALLIPTPGQTEQEYLAQRAEVIVGYHCQQQSQLDIPGVFADVAVLKLNLPDQLLQQFNQTERFTEFPK